MKRRDGSGGPENIFLQGVRGLPDGQSQVTDLPPPPPPPNGFLPPLFRLHHVEGGKPRSRYDGYRCPLGSSAPPPPQTSSGSVDEGRLIAWPLDARLAG